MTKSEFVDQVADRAGLSKKDAGDAVDAVLDTIEDALKRGSDVTFSGFGKFSVSHAQCSRGSQPRDRREDPDRRVEGPEVHGWRRTEEGGQVVGRAAGSVVARRLERAASPLGTSIAYGAGHR